MNDPAIQELLARAPHISQDEVLAHPCFAEARKLYLDRFLAVYGDDPFLVRLLIETGRFLVFHLALLLEALHDPARRETWFTVGRLKQQMATFGLGTSERQVDHLISRLRAVGFLEVLPAPRDRRLRILKPTEAMLAHDRDWLAAHYAPLTVICPYNDYSLVMERDPAFQLVQRRTSLAFAPLGLKLLMSEPDMMLFFNRAAGHMVLAALAAQRLVRSRQSACRGALYRYRFGVSRTHVRELLSTAEDIGLVKLQARGGHRVEILPRLWKSHDRAIAGGMSFHDLIYGAVTGRKALQRIGT